MQRTINVSVLCLLLRTLVMPTTAHSGWTRSGREGNQPIHPTNGFDLGNADPFMNGER